VFCLLCPKGDLNPQDGVILQNTKRSTTLSCGRLTPGRQGVSQPTFQLSISAPAPFRQAALSFSASGSREMQGQERWQSAPGSRSNPRPFWFFGANVAAGMCAQRGAAAEMIPLNDAGVVSNLPPGEVRTWIESPELHRNRTPDGASVICRTRCSNGVRRRGPHHCRGDRSVSSRSTRNESRGIDHGCTGSVTRATCRCWRTEDCAGRALRPIQGARRGQNDIFGRKLGRCPFGPTRCGSRFPDSLPKSSGAHFPFPAPRSLW
jgi:hypothetical protein